MFLQDIPKESQKEFLASCFEFYCTHATDVNLMQNNPFHLKISDLLSYIHLYLEQYEKEITEPLSFLKIQKPNFILKKMGVSKPIYVLYRNIEEKIFVSNYCYETLLYHTEHNMRTLAADLGCGSKKIKTLAIWYAVNMKEISPETFLETQSKNQAKWQQDCQKEYWKKQPLTYDTNLLELMELEKEDEIIDYFINHPINTLYLYERIFPFVLLRFPERKNTLIDELKLKVKIYQKYLEQKRKEKIKEEKEQQKEKLLLEAKLCILNFLKDTTSKSKEVFCKKNEISHHQFEKYMELIEESDEKIYEEATKKLKQNSIRYFMYQKEQVNQVLYFLKNGVLEDNVLRPFNLLDYYFLTKKNFKDFYNLLKEDHPKEDRILWKEFEQKYQNIPSISIESLLKIEKEYNCLRDEKNRPIPKTGKLLTLEEKHTIISFLKQHHIPINQVTFHLAFERFQRNTELKPNLQLSIQKKA